MNKFAVIFIFLTSLVLSNASNSALITNSSLLTSEHYVTYVGVDETIDFAWVSSINVEYWGDPSLSTTNRLYEPSLHQGWDFASDKELDILFNNFSLNDFKKGDNYIQAVSFWNTIHDDVVVKVNGMVFDSNILNFMRNNASSQWASSGVDGQNATGAEKETFYVRRTINSVPEPSTLMIFSLGLIALTSKKKLFS
jgi:hypothetical protein